MAYVRTPRPYRPRGGLAGLDLSKLLRTVAGAADTVAGTARAAAGAAPAVSFATRYKWPLVIGSSALFGAAAVYLLKRHRSR